MGAGYALSPMAMFEYQTPAILNQANPTQNLFYDILPATDNVRVYAIAVNVEDNDETLQIRITVDGEVLGTLSVACTHSTNYMAWIYPSAITRNDVVYFAAPSAGESFRVAPQAFILEGHSVQVEVRKTTAAGVGNLTGIVVYGVMTKIT